MEDEEKRALLSRLIEVFRSPYDYQIQEKDQTADDILLAFRMFRDELNRK